MNDVIIVGIAGGSGSGKTTLAQKLVDRLGENRCLIVSQDSYYLDLSHLSEGERHKVNFDHPDAIDWVCLHHQISELRHRQTVSVPVYDFATHTRSAVQRTSSADIVILEGHLILHQEMIRSLLDLKIFLHHAPDIMLARRILRDIAERGRTAESVIEQYLETVRPMYLGYVEPYQTFSDLVYVFDDNQREIISDVLAQLETLRIQD